MYPSGFSFELLHTDRYTGARRARLTTPRGAIELPTFMPVGTQAAVKGLTPRQVANTGSQILLGNTYHLAVRPGAELIASLGGLHEFMNWHRPILTDSGGFQLFSLAQLTRITERGATFRSHVDGSPMELTPESSVEIQQRLGSDIAMVFDHLIQLPASRSDVEEAMLRTVRWAERCRAAHDHSGQLQFGIVQGGLEPDLRRQCATMLREIDFPGYAVGGLSVGEAPADMYRTIEATTPHLPENRPRYLMGVGTPTDLLECIGRGIDMFDCVMPTRNGRNSMAFTDQGPLKLKNARFRDDPRPIQADIESECSSFSRAYLRHLFQAGEMLGPILVSIHNLSYYQTLMRQAREAIENDAYRDFVAEKMSGWATAASST